MIPIDNGSLTSVPGVQVGHWTNAEARTGCTVVVLPEPNVAGGEVRGAAPGTRETALLEPGMTVEAAQAFVLTGGSAFGLATVDGVMGRLEAAERGYPTRIGVIPIVPAAVLFDLGVGASDVRPGAAEGAAAYDAASTDPVPAVAIGAATGATAAKWRGEPTPTVLGSAAVTVDGATVAALVAVNALGDVFSLDGRSLTGGPHASGPPATPPPVGENTTLAVVVTDAALDRAQLSRLAVRAHDAFGACLRPAHTRFDGDVVFTASVGAIEASIDAVGEAAFAAVGYAIEASIPAP
ncbi:MAG: P1 family peptidase [Actinomycetota bacterium]